MKLNFDVFLALTLSRVLLCVLTTRWRHSRRSQDCDERADWTLAFSSRLDPTGSEKEPEEFLTIQQHKTLFVRIRADSQKSCEEDYAEVRKF